MSIVDATVADLKTRESTFHYAFLPAQESTRVVVDVRGSGHTITIGEGRNVGAVRALALRLAFEIAFHLAKEEEK